MKPLKLMILPKGTGWFFTMSFKKRFTDNSSLCNGSMPQPFYFPDHPLNQRDSFFNPALLVKIEKKVQQPKLALFDFVVPVQAGG